MKRIVSVSLGSSKRNKNSHCVLLGQEYSIERHGVDGDLNKFKEKLLELDGKVEAIGLGGIDLYLWTAKKRYTIRDAKKLADCVKNTPVVDGSGIKNTIERMTISWLSENNIIDFSLSTALMVCGLDRFGMAQSLSEVCSKVIYGDAMFALGIPIKINSYKSLCVIATLLLPFFCNIPFKWLYPTGNKQSEHIEKYTSTFASCDIICGDYLYINKYLPSPQSGALKDKTIITNTLTTEDVLNLKERGVKLIVSTTPQFDGRNFGTNVLEGIMTSILGKSIYDASDEEIKDILTKLNWKPTIVYSKE
ncbi:MAG: quinate 5-dehydrogenase [Abditibacteriota bacterium]|nr:quinate 5-dehydrogenase [Abditibacteriota bacterium]